MRSFCKGWGLINTVYVCQQLVYYSNPVSLLETLTISVKGGAYTCCNSQQSDSYSVFMIHMPAREGMINIVHSFEC